MSLGKLYLFPCFLQAKGSSFTPKLVTRSNCEETFLSVWREKWWFWFWSQPPFVKDGLISLFFLDWIVHSMLHGQGYDMDNNSHNLSHPFFSLCFLSFSPYSYPIAPNWSQAFFFFFFNLIQGCESPKPAPSNEIKEPLPNCFPSQNIIIHHSILQFLPRDPWQNRN